MFGNIQWISYKGKEILFNDRRNLKPDEISCNSEEAVKTVLNSGKNDILYLVDNTSTIITPEAKETIKKGGKEINPYIKKSAVIGASSAQKILLNILSSITGMNIRVFDDIDRAKEWLIS